MSGVGERRQTARHVFENPILPKAKIEWQGRAEEGVVTDISQQGLRVLFPTSCDSWLKPRTRLKGSVTVWVMGNQRSLRRLTVAERGQAEDDDRQVRLISQDEATQATLWLIMEAGKAGRVSFQSQPKSLTQDEVPRIPARGIYSEEARLRRLNYVRESCEVRLDTMQDFGLSAQRLTGNIENLIGSVEIPVGVAGPLLFRGEKARGFIYAPMATSEGTLVASATRGATAISRSGGVATQLLGQRMLRTPVFELSNMESAYLFARWIEDHQDQLGQQVGKVSQYAQLSSAKPHLDGKRVRISFVYETGDAAGQNMTTACTWHACQWLMSKMQHYPELEFDNFVIDGNTAGDKKVTYQSFISGRGSRVSAECVLSKEVIEQVLKLSPEQLLWTHEGCVAGAVNAGMVGYNINVSNVLAAMFTATGQDIACVHESSLAQLDLRPADNGAVYASMLMPGIVIGTVGGGTGLPRQNELLQMMDCCGPGKVSRLAEIIVGYCLALDLSTLAAVASGQFATAHERLGRNKPVQWFGKQDLTNEFFQEGLRRVLDDPCAQLTQSEEVTDITLGSSIITELTARKVNKLVGHLPYRLHYQSHAQPKTAEVLVKVKPLDEEVILMVNAMAHMCGTDVANGFSNNRSRAGNFTDCHLRELAIYDLCDPRFREHMPLVYATHRDDQREAYLVVLERLQGMIALDSADDISCWGPREIKAALCGAAQFHSVFYNRFDELAAQPWIGPYPTANDMIAMTPYWEALAVHAAQEFPEWVSPDDLVVWRRIIAGIGDWWRALETMPRTLIHNDFNPRNICLRPVSGTLRLCAYDWELATIHLPQHDLAELLCFVLTPDTSPDTVAQYVEHHRVALEKALGQPVDKESWLRGFRYSLYDLMTHRMAMYIMAHTFRHYAFMERVVNTLRRLISFSIA